MILKRIATSLRRQDWPAVVIELTLVMLGVWLGLQAQQWSEQLEQQDLYLGSVQLAIEELTVNIASATSLRDRVRQAESDMIAARRSLPACDNSAETLVAVNRSLATFTRRGDITLDLRATEELLLNDNYTRLIPRELRKTLIELVKFVESRTNVLDKNFNEILWRNHPFDSLQVGEGMREIGGENDPPQLINPVAIACKDQEFVKTFSRAITLYFLAAEYVEDMADRMGETQRALENELGRYGAND